ncbi:ABC-F family ATP-binding cassette domain-containing protein [Cytobacillus sp. IB215665]|uniref:ABC-F family ATP-binding cassette domain-containing protein n=1 Tax=Cytobacillus sp. IB215665 TaxID=3097357 RepID=UPI002A0E017B|nr:ABC-F family ATP-binding cassette domain-containing protein [Cytobacillus sp. IB215665]MDX8367922.1 ABC-F family ATP-binding cassette domain-containing protein [Cytobacillus sp. IB215665]
MIVLQVNQLTKYFGSDLILSNIKLEVQLKDRIAVVGRNGAGKSTLLKIIAGYMSHDSGSVMKPKDISIGYLAQHSGLDSDLSIWEEMLTVFEPLKKMEIELRKLEEKMSNQSLMSNKADYDKLLKEYDHLQIQYKEQGGYQYEADVRAVLHGLQFSSFNYSTPISSLSGGQKTRLALGKLLLAKPNLLILDEPTNHLDIDTLTWLEQYLLGYPGAILIVSHDRYFLDKVVTQVYEISRTNSAKFIGNYSDYLKKKAENYEHDLKLYEKQQGEIAKLKDFVQRNLARASTTKRAQSRRKQLEKMTVLDKPTGDEKSASFHFDIERQSGNEVLKAKDISVSYENNKPIIQHINFQIMKSDSVALVGPNGIGKSTLLKAAINKIQALQGEFSFGSNVKVGYYDQEQANLSSNKSVLNELWDEYPSKPEKDIRTVLGNFLFSGDDVLKPVSTLSGGQKARLALAKLMLQKANLLILDEPTNHLDLDSKEVLENALIDYPGTILFVSHDRYFINRLATKVYELTTNGITEYLGDYDYFISKKAEIEELKLLNEQKVVSPSIKEDKTQTKLTYEQDKEMKKLQRQRKRRIEELEIEISKLEEKIDKNETLLCDPTIFQDHEKVAVINEENSQYQEQLEQLMTEWETLHD